MARGTTRRQFLAEVSAAAAMTMAFGNRAALGGEETIEHRSRRTRIISQRFYNIRSSSS